MMADASRCSTFPPLLGQYNPTIDSKAEGTAGLYGAKSRVRSLLERRQTPRSSSDHKRRLNRYGLYSKRTKPLAVSVESISKKLERDAERKRYEKAEATVKTWDALLREDKVQKHHNLQERVKVQRELIDKNDELFNYLRIKAEEEKLEKLHQRKEAQKEIVAGLKAHLQRVEEHKTRIQKKMQEISLVNEGVPPTKENDDSIHKDIELPAIEVEDTLYGSEVSTRSSERTQEVILKLLGVDSSDNTGIDSMWRNRKTDVIRKLTPMVKHSDQLKQVASPSVKQCLEIYEKPTTRDRYTGKPIPLSDVLGEMSITRGQQYSTRNSALELVTRQTQKRAEIMLQRKEPFNTLESYDLYNYVEEDVDLDEQPSIPRSKSATVGKPNTTLQPRRAKTGTASKVKKKLPSYLTPDGDLCSGSLEEFGDTFYCAPSRKKNEERIMDKYSHSNDSVFLTDLHAITFPPYSTSSSHSDLTKGSRTEVTTNRKPSWQPLCSSALSEHSRVTEVPVARLGHLAHGRYSMWKPNTCIVDSDNSRYV